MESYGPKERESEPKQCARTKTGMETYGPGEKRRKYYHPVVPYTPPKTAYQEARDILCRDRHSTEFLDKALTAMSKRAKDNPDLTAHELLTTTKIKYDPCGSYLRAREKAHE